MKGKKNGYTRRSHEKWISLEPYPVDDVSNKGKIWHWIGDKSMPVRSMPIDGYRWALVIDNEDQVIAAPVPNLVLASFKGWANGVVSIMNSDIADDRLSNYSEEAHCSSSQMGYVPVIVEAALDGVGTEKRMHHNSRIPPKIN